MPEKPDLAAPGESITTTSGTSGWTTASGCSYATPITGGMAAVVIQDLRAHNTFDNLQVLTKAILINSADGKVGTKDAKWGWWHPEWGWGQLNGSQAWSDDYKTAISSVAAGSEVTCYFDATVNSWQKPLPTHPSGQTEGGAANQPQPFEPIRKMPYSINRREPVVAVPLPVYRDGLNSIVLGQVVQVQDIAIPCVDPRTAVSCDPFPAKLYTVKSTRVYKGDPGQSVLVRQLVPSERVLHPDGKPDPLMSVGSTYLFFFSPPGGGVFEEQGSRLELGADNRLIPTPHTSAVLKPIFGLTPDEAAVKLLQP